MTEQYKYIYTNFSIFGSLPTYKVFTSSESNNIVKLVFVDGTFIYKNKNELSFIGSDLDMRNPTWSQEDKYLIEVEKRMLKSYKNRHPGFQTKKNE